MGHFIGGSGSKDCNTIDNQNGWNNSSNTYWVDPSFVDISNENFYITINSPAIETCSNGDPGIWSQGEVRDIDGQLAPVDELSWEMQLVFLVLVKTSTIILMTSYSKVVLSHYK